jgi:hypothetical protein
MLRYYVVPLEKKTKETKTEEKKVVRRKKKVTQESKGA